MPDLAVTSPTAGTPSETPVTDDGSNSGNRTPLLHLHAPRDSTPTTTIPPTLTPATTTRPSIALSTIWRNGNLPTNTPHSTPLVAAIVAHTPSRETQGPTPSDLATSTSSVPSATTTLTNTLPPTQSAALRALNAPAFQSHSSSSSNTKHHNRKSSAKSTSSSTTLSSQPVVVRTYSGPRRHRSQASNSSSRFYTINMNGHTSSQNPSNLSAGLASQSGSRTPQLPPVDDFSFSAILRAVDPEIRDAIDAIAEICARSRLSLADEYDAHLPPQGTITGTGTGIGQGWVVGRAALVSGRGRGVGVVRGAQGWGAAGAGVGGENTLTAVPEASSSSERLSVAGEPSTKDQSRSAYGSLKSVISGASGGGRSRRKTVGADTFNATSTSTSKADGPDRPQQQTNIPSLALISTPQPSHHLSLDLSSTITDVPLPETRSETAAANTSSFTIQNDSNANAGRTHRRNLSSMSRMSVTRPRSSTLSSLASWVPWNRTNADVSSESATTRAEMRLREVLSLAGQQQQGISRKKGGVSVV
ncbi:uncharacterized protein EI97DRAFT_442483 [Westerdykella ornata]|uniref:Uncharacterized protein n=1 Tax=Westerdykella ornata TaxID=318751 RepID=A0A6A6JNQ4_WESOR|nr:uncharacterized protein EI97DRAFT_442483 [Westerdykella ornata]KAF2276559.1 hypothetical protein EI97DRAFT_442483 [Westerdykella ornata]